MLPGPSNQRRERPMKKENFTYNINEDNANQFAVVPAEDLKRIAEYVSLLRNQLSFLDAQLEALGIRTWELQVKTLADVKVNRHESGN